MKTCVLHHPAKLILRQHPKASGCEERESHAGDVLRLYSCSVSRNKASKHQPVLVLIVSGDKHRPEGKDRREGNEISLQYFTVQNLLYTQCQLIFTHEQSPPAKQCVTVRTNRRDDGGEALIK